MNAICVRKLKCNGVVASADIMFIRIVMKILQLFQKLSAKTRKAQGLSHGYDNVIVFFIFL